MAFPTTSILDNFNRADAADITGSASWISDGLGLNPWELTSNRASNAFGPHHGNFWNASFTNFEVYATVTGGLTGTNQIALGGRYSSNNGYFLFYQHLSGSPTLGIYKHVSGAGSIIGANLTFSGISVGDKLGFSANGTTLTAWVYQSGTWSSLGTRTDSTYSSGGKLWMYSRNNSGTVTLDDFGGGEAVVTSAVPIFYHHLQTQGIN